MRQWVLFQQLRYYSLCFCLFFVLLLHQTLLQSVGKWAERKRRCTLFPAEGKCLGIATGCCGCSALAEPRHHAAKLRPKAASCCPNKTHCLSLSAKSYSCRLFLHRDGKFRFFPFVFQNMGLAFRVLAASCLRQYCHSSREALAIQRSSSAARLARVKSIGTSPQRDSIPTVTRTHIPEDLMSSPFQPFVTHFCWFNISLLDLNKHLHSTRASSWLCVFGCDFQPL